MVKITKINEVEFLYEDEFHYQTPSRLELDDLERNSFYLTKSKPHPQKPVYKSVQ